MLHCSGSFEFSSETNKSILFESQVEEKKVESPLADYNSPSPTFSVENTKPLISGFVASTMGTCVPAICCRFYSCCLCTVLVNLMANRKPSTDISNGKDPGWSHGQDAGC